MKKQKQTRITLLAVILAVVLLATAVICFVNFRQTGHAGDKTLTVNIAHNDGSTRTIEVQTDEEYLADALEPYDIIAGTESEYGLFILTVDGETADDAQGEYWMFDINGEMAAYGADSQPVADGDVIDFYTIAMS